jgi:hypothetical protein
MAAAFLLQVTVFPTIRPAILSSGRISLALTDEWFFFWLRHSASANNV